MQEARAAHLLSVSHSMCHASHSGASLRVCVCVQQGAAVPAAAAADGDGGGRPHAGLHAAGWRAAVQVPGLRVHPLPQHCHAAPHQERHHRARHSGARTCMPASDVMRCLRVFARKCACALVCAHLRLHVYLHLCLRMYLRACVCTCICTCVCTCTCTCVCTCTCTCVCASICARVGTSVCARVFARARVCVSMLASLCGHPRPPNMHSGLRGASSACV